MTKRKIIIHNIVTVLCNDYIKGVKQRNFILSSIIIPALFLIFILSKGAFTPPQDSKNVIVLHHSGAVLRPGDNLRFVYKDCTLEEALFEMGNKTAAAVLDYNRMDTATLEATLHLTPGVTASQSRYIKNNLEHQYTDYLLQSKNIDMEEITNKARANIRLTDVTVQAPVPKKTSYTWAVAFISIFLVYFSIFQFSSLVMKSISLEKNSRIIEIVFSSVKPKEYLAGKIIGSGLLGITQFAFWVVGCVVILNLTTHAGGEDIAAAASSGTVSEFYSYMFSFDFIVNIVLFFVFFLLGYLLYSAIFALIGSLSNQYTDSQQFVMPVTILLLLTFIYCSQHIGSSNEIINGLSYFPLTSPVAMLVRIPFGVNALEVVVSIVLLLVTIGLIMYYTSNILSKLVLDYSSQYDVRNIFYKLREKYK